MLTVLEHTLCTWRDPFNLGLCAGLARHTYPKNRTSGRKSFISCSSNTEKELHVPSDIQLANSKVIYSVASATGHNQLAHPESNLRVSAIVGTLENMELTPKFHGMEIVELKHFRPASVEDITSVHERTYVLGLEKAMEQASEQGLIIIDGSAPTYATPSTFQDSLIAAGAGLAVVDSVSILGDCI